MSFPNKKKIIIFSVSAIVTSAVLIYLYLFRTTVYQTNFKDVQSAEIKNIDNNTKIGCDFDSSGKVSVLDSEKSGKSCLYLGCGAFF